MKVRNGFVSNSSSSSFCIYGVCLDEQVFEGDEAIEAFQKLCAHDKEAYVARIQGWLDKAKQKLEEFPDREYLKKQARFYEALLNIENATEEDKEAISYYAEEQEYFWDVFGLEYHCMYLYERCGYVGRSWSSVKDDETGAQFRKSVEDALAVIGLDGKACTVEEAWRDG